MAILDSLDAELPMVSNIQKLDNGAKQGNPKFDGSGIVWDLERLGNLSLQISGKKLIFAFDGTSSEAFRATGTLSILSLVDPLSAAASPIGDMKAGMSQMFRSFTMVHILLVGELYYFIFYAFPHSVQRIRSCKEANLTMPIAFSIM
uniref:Uncharacterized protein n=1 Tax=Nelumbo nucifera TaxID=4432 RepID=A0A822X9G5_NELNU|nr:TPA_asm: hypothetical protein HUJ06_019577 [Nelumbo nucifera]